MKDHKKENSKIKTDDDIVSSENEAEIAEDRLSNQDDKNELQILRDENTKLKDSFLRAYAEAENIKKRCQTEIEKNSKYAIASFAKELLTVADNLQRAVTSVDEKHQEQCKDLLEGIKMTQKELSNVFAKFGIKKIDSLDKIFDPNFERVVQEVEDDTKPAGTVIAELQSAYTLNDRILREAMVIVTKN